jgi:uncharacterized protein YndB with AHSA1/START domain
MMTSTRATVDAVRKTVTVDCGLEHAFRIFTEGIGSWWPLHTHSISAGGPSGTPEIFVLEPRSGGRLFERTRDGSECEWGRILVWEPPGRLVLEWSVNPEAPSTEVEVRFSAHGERTQVELEHRGWERFPPEHGPKARASYASAGGWEEVLGAYVEAADS